MYRTLSGKNHVLNHLKPFLYVRMMMMLFRELVKVIRFYKGTRGTPVGKWVGRRGRLVTD